jgi:hypothetical protein
VRIFVRKRLKLAACAACCNLHAEGRYHPDYRLKLLASGEADLQRIRAEKRAG